MRARLLRLVGRSWRSSEEVRTGESEHWVCIDRKLRSLLVHLPRPSLTTMDHPSSVKRKKSQEELSSTNASKKARKRVRYRSYFYYPTHSTGFTAFSLSAPSYSCGECHRRKQKVRFVTDHPCHDTYLCPKCDRQVPCSHCVSRKVPELCKAYSPGKPDQDVHSRLTRIESVLEAAVPQLWSQSDRNFSRRSASPGMEDDAGIPEGNDNMTGVFYRGSWLGSSVVGSIASPIVLEQVSSTPDTYFPVLIGSRSTISSTIRSLLSIQASQPMEGYSLLLLKILGLRGNTQLRIISTHLSRIVAFPLTRLPSCCKSYPQRT